MDWNANASLLWDWDNHPPFGGNYKLSTAAIVVGGGGASSGSELGNFSSSKSTISASSDSSSKAGREREFDANPRTQDKNKFLQESGCSLAEPPAAGLEESQIGLKLGKRTYFEDASTESNTKNPLSSLDAASVAPALVKKSRVSHQSAQTTCCQVEGCNVDLSGAKDYHRKHRVCESHSKCPKVVVAGQERRFCQQCSRFHELSEFDQKKRSCRRRLSDHNARRRKPRPNLISFNSTAFSPSFYDGKHQLNLLWNKTPFCQMRSMVGSTSEGLQNFKLTQTKGPWMKSTKEGCIDGQLHLPNTQLSNGFFSLYHDVDKLLPFKGTAAEVLNQGSEASAGASNLDGAQDLRRALSLLSTNSWGSSPDPGQTSSIVELVDANHAGTAHPVMPTANSSNHWIYGQPVAAQQAQLLPYSNTMTTMHRNANQPQEFQLYRETLFDPSRIH